MQCVSSGSAFMPRGQMDPEPLLSSLDDPSEYLLVSVSGSAGPGRCVSVGEETHRRGFPQVTQVLTRKSNHLSVNTAVACEHSGTVVGVSVEQLAFLFLYST